MPEVDIKKLARLGAQVRLAELVAEMDALLKQFPRLAKTKTPAQDGQAPEVGSTPKARKRRRISAAARKAASERMKKYWAERKKGKA